MSVQQTYSCDVCGKVRGEMNHWWLVSGFGPEDITLLGIQPWDSAEAALAEAHLCGEKCLHDYLSQWLSRQGK